MNIRCSALTIVMGITVVGILAPTGRVVAAGAADPFEMLNAIPPLPANVAAAAAATQVTPTGADRGQLRAPAYEALAIRITKALKPSLPAAGGGIDFARAASDPTYAAQMQARMQTMSTAEKMALANQMMAAQQAAAGNPRDVGQIAGFVGGQRSADIAAQQKMRTVLEGVLGNSGARHRAVDDAINSTARSCPQDKTGWPLKTCTDPLGSKSIAQHRAVEDAALAGEAQALAQARLIALAELNKGRDLLAHATGSGATPLLAWAMIYVQMLDDYAKAMTLRAGFWAHADASKYTGQVSDFIGATGGEVSWPLKNAAYGEQVNIGL